MTTQTQTLVGRLFLGSILVFAAVVFLFLVELAAAIVSLSGFPPLLVTGVAAIVLIVTNYPRFASGSSNETEQNSLVERAKRAYVDGEIDERELEERLDRVIETDESA